MTPIPIEKAKMPIVIYLDHSLLSFPGYTIETENNLQCARVAFYISIRIIFIPISGQTSGLYNTKRLYNWTKRLYNK